MTGLTLFKRTAVAVVVLMLISFPIVSFAGTVTTLLDDGSAGSLREVIVNAAPGEIIDFAVTGTIALTMGEIAIDKNLTITGPGPDMLIIDAQMNSRMFNIDNGNSSTCDSITMSGLTLRNGSDGSVGGAILTRESLNLDSTKFLNNTSPNGGAILGVFSSGIRCRMDIAESEFRENMSTQNGGAIRDAGFKLNIKKTDFIDNTAGLSGGVLYHEAEEIEEISDSTFEGNKAEFGSGGVIFSFGSNGKITLITRSVFRNNEAFTRGGAIVETGDIGSETISDSLFENNSSPLGGAIYSTRKIENIIDTTFKDNTADNDGGAIWNTGTIYNIENVTFTGNSADRGGAIFNDQGETIRNILNSTFHMNTAAGNGGGIFNDVNGVVYVNFSTFSTNTAALGGGVYENADETIHFRNSILASNMPNNCDGGNFPDDEAGNHSDDASCALTGDNATLVLDVLTDNGGPTQTVALLSGDPQDGAQDCMGLALDDTNMPFMYVVNTDQRGALRAFGAQCDAGSFELGALIPGEDFFHNPITPAIANNINILTAEAATLEGPVAFVWGFMPGSVMIGGATCNGTEIEIKNPRLLAIVNSSTEGIAELIFFIPLIGDFEFTVFTQAIDISTCNTSEVIEDVIRKE